MISFGSNGNGALGRETKEKYDFIDDTNMKNEKIVFGCAQFYGSILLCFSKDNPCKFYGFGYNANGYFFLKYYFFFYFQKFIILFYFNFIFLKLNIQNKI